MKKIKIKILKKGDKVLNVFNYLQSTAISVQRKNSNVDIILLEPNKDKIPEITSIWTICEGDNEVEIITDDIKISTF
ncbi:hypothetical protein [Aliarcobacter butzleri]|uniref:hypothetical protein n=1 Tax=Aliarcobacter butzleri TaxID=28197 RepID=UPI0012F7F848|nr:hypothetical protein [Aliarcobacter butzleri]